MRRRDFVKGILAASAAAQTLAAQQAAPAAPSPLPAAPHTLPPPVPVAPGPTPWMTGLMEVKPLELSTLIPDAVAQTDAHFFSAVQVASLRRLCNFLMPALGAYPGALEAGTPEFLDFLIGVSPKPMQQMYEQGLDRLDAEAQHSFRLPFAQVTDPQADALIRPLLRAWMSDHPPIEPHARFINLAHHDIRTATVNSQAWSDAKRAEGDATAGLDLYWYPVDPDIHRNQSDQHQMPLSPHTTGPREGHGTA
jgi:hypothetical protein